MVYLMDIIVGIASSCEKNEAHELTIIKPTF
jgi:hypothetical protein